MLLSIRTPTHNRARYVFDGVASIGLDDAATAIFRTDLANARVEGATTVGLRAGTGGADQLSVTSALVTCGTDFSFGVNKTSGSDLEVEALATSSLSYYLPVGFNTLPIIPGWPGTSTYDGITSTLTTSEVSAVTKYELKIAHSILGDVGANYTIYAPINIGNDMDNIRNLYGVVRLMSGAVVTRVYGLPPNDISVEAPFNVDVWLTIANLAGFHLVSINMVKVIGDWEIIVTIETKHPLLHSP